MRALELSAGNRIKADVSFDLTPEEIISIRVPQKQIIAARNSPRCSTQGGADYAFCSDLRLGVASRPD